MPRGVYLLGESEYRKRLRRLRAALGLCRLCSQKRAPGFSVCARHLKYLREWRQGRAA